MHNCICEGHLRVKGRTVAWNKQQQWSILLPP